MVASAKDSRTPRFAANGKDRQNQPRMNTDDTDPSHPDVRASRLAMRSPELLLLRRWVSKRAKGNFRFHPRPTMLPRDSETL